MAKRNDPKADRKQKLAELKREQRARERRKTWITVGIATLLSLGLIGAVVVPAVLKDRKAKNATKALAGEAAKPLSAFGVKQADAQCSPEKIENPIPKGGDHAVEGEKIDYPVAPPNAGKHTGNATVAIATGFYDRSPSQPTIERAVHSLEHGVVVAWYDKQLPEAEVKELRKIGASAVNKKDRFVAMPWDRTDFSDKKPFVLTSWGHTQRCGKVSGEAIAAFVKKNADSKDAPERGGGV